LRPMVCALRPMVCALRPMVCALRPMVCALRPMVCALRPKAVARALLRLPAVLGGVAAAVRLNRTFRVVGFSAAPVLFDGDILHLVENGIH
jgi:hypothetical protein